MEEVDEVDLVVERVAALDLGKAALEACMRVPHPTRPGRRMQELRSYATTTAQLLEMVAWFRHWQVQRVVMESTSTYWNHHAVILKMMLDNTDRISTQIAALDARIAEAIGPFSRQAGRLTDITGIDAVGAAELIGEIGVDLTRFPSAAHLVSWAKFCPQTHRSAGKSRSKGRGKGNPWLAGTLGRIVFGNCRADTFLGARYRRLARRRGKQKAIVATANSVLTVVYHLLSNPDATFCDLGPDYYESRINKHRRARNLATQLQALTGQTIVIRDGKAVITDTAA